MNVRQYAYSVLENVILQDGYASLLLRKNNDLSTTDMALASEIVYGTLRWWDYLEYQWKDFVKGKTKSKVAIVLNMSVYQLQYLDRIPSYAIIHEGVNLVGKSEKGFVNAILRKVAERGKIEVDTNDELQKISIETNHPEWLVRLWKSQYGEEVAYKICKHDQERPIVYGRVNPLKIDPTMFLAKDGIHQIEDTCFTYDGVITSLPEFERGEVLIQARSSQRIVNYLDLKDDMNVMDVCSAPGTKTQQIAVQLHNTGHIDAFDLHAHRVELIQSLMKQTGVTNVQATSRDARTPLVHPKQYDRILIDAPCSGLGDLSHKPEIRRHVTPESLDEIIQLQKDILEMNVQYLKDEGILVYSTCTLNKKENEKQIAALLARHPELQLIQEKTFFPFDLASDGFYVAQIKKTSEGIC